MKAVWALYRFTPDEIAHALAAVNRKLAHSVWRPQRGTLMDDDGVRTGQVALRTHGPTEVVTTNSRERSRFMERLARKTG